MWRVCHVGTLFALMGIELGLAPMFRPTGAAAQ